MIRVFRASPAYYRYKLVLWGFSQLVAVAGLIGGLIVAGSIFGLGLRAVRTMRATGQDENPWKPTPSIIESGPYRFTRNPMYLQIVIVCVGFAFILQNLWILALTPFAAWALYALAIRPEEEYLERKFGEQYLAYKRRVPRWL